MDDSCRIFRAHHIQEHGLNHTLTHDTRKVLVY
jgi:hypothetical protein